MVNLFDYLLFIKKEDSANDGPVPASFFKCGKCCIKEGMDKADRLEMFWTIERNVKQDEMYCCKCQGRFAYGANGALTTKGGE